MTVAEAARVLEVRPTTVYSLCSAGLLAHLRVGLGRGVIRITREALDAYIASCSVETRISLPRVTASGTGLAVEDLVGQALAREERRRMR